MNVRFIFAIGILSSIVFFASSKIYKHRPSAFIESLPYAENSGIIKKVTSIEVQDVDAPYNPGLIPFEDGYLVVFRTDCKQRKTIFGFKTPFREKIQSTHQKMPYKTEFRILFLDSLFRPKGRSIKLNTGSDFSEDPRLFTYKNDIYITYNDLCQGPVDSRAIRLAKINLETAQLEQIVCLDPNLQQIEKNWVPFVIDETIHFVYAFSPHLIFQLKDPTSAQMTWLPNPNQIAFQKTPWASSFGIVRGGTPPLLVDGQYLSFFHSFFRENRHVWYVMGAYTFEAHPPFRVTSCSKLPLKFKGMYSTLPKNTASRSKSAIYPSGIALGKEDGKDVIHVACGENDCSLKIVTFDKDLLLKNLTPIPEPL